MTIIKPFFDIQAQYKEHKKEINIAIQEVLDSGKFIMGPQVKLLEQELEKYTQAKHCISCANGTDALQIAMMAIGIKPGDEVITTPFTFGATAETISLLGAKPVFVDIEEDSFLIDAGLIAAKITPKTKAIIPVSLYGQIPDMDAINSIAREYSKKFGHKIYVIEDAAQSFGAEYNGRKSCNVSDIATTSFFPTKPLGCYGDGGAIFTSDLELANIMKQIRVHGQKERYCHVRVGVNSRLDTIQAAILLVKIKYFDEEVEIRRKRAKEYSIQYVDSDIITPCEMENRKHVYGQYTVRVSDRESFQSELLAQGIPTTVHYPIPLNQQPAFEADAVNCPISDALSDEVVSLPICLYNS
jgi:UDP-2-acetamido-2-deoxy-ribo-hexuluronate aminotransferase